MLKCFVFKSFQWGPISPNKRRASVQTFLQARGAAIDPLGVAVDPANSRSQDSGQRELHHDLSLRAVASRSNDSGDEKGIVVGGFTRLNTLNKIFGEASEEKAFVVEEREDLRAESSDTGNTGQSVEEQLRQALERCVGLVGRYDCLLFNNIFICLPRSACAY